MKTLEETLENSYNIHSILLAMQIQQDENESLKKQVEWFKQQYKLSQGREFGKSSETSQSLSLFDEKMDQSPDESNDLLLEEKETITYERSKKMKGRQMDVSRFPKEQITHDLKEEEKTCGCGETLEKVGEDISTQVDHIPETFKVIEHITLKYCCRHCDIMKSAKKPETGIPKCMATPGFVAEVITKKYEQHLPLYRQSKIFSKLGADIPDSTLGHWVMRAAECLKPLDQAARDQIPHVYVLQADETKIKTLKPSKEGYLWGYHSCDPGNRFILFEYSPSRGALTPNTTLKNFKGNLQTDGYSGYNDLRAKQTVTNFGCWDHCRRKFTDVIKVADKNKTGKAAETVLLINKLYEYERDAKDMSFAERKEYRQKYAKPMLDHIHDHIASIQAPPKSLLGVAVTYITNQWVYLIEYIDHGEVPMSNCWIENQIRPFALGRRNWLFTGTPESAAKAALLYSLIQSCRMNNIDPRIYLEHVLNKANAMRRGDVSPTSLLPQFIDKSILKPRY